MLTWKGLGSPSQTSPAGLPPSPAHGLLQARCVVKASDRRSDYLLLVYENGAAPALPTCVLMWKDLGSPGQIPSVRPYVP